MSSLTTIIKAAFGIEYTGDQDLGNNRFSLASFADVPLSNGVGDNQADVLFVDNRTLAASTSEELDLAGVLENPVGETATFVTVKGILVRAGSANGGLIKVGGAAANTFLGPFDNATDIINVKASGIFLEVEPLTGWTVTAGTGDKLKIENSDASPASYDIAIIGTSS